MPTLCEAINKLVEQRLRRALETGETINVPDLASEITESLADLIVTGALPEEQPRLIDHVVSELDRFVTEKRRARSGSSAPVDGAFCLTDEWAKASVAPPQEKVAPSQEPN
jgi:hypothetical protein